MPGPIDAESSARLARRYPPPRVSRRVWIVAIAVLAPLLIAGWIWLAAVQSHSEVSASVRTFEVFDDRIEAVVTVYRSDPGRAAVCEVFAQAVNFERVGEVDADIPAADPVAGRQIDVAVTVRTYRRATAIDIEDCVVEP